MPADDLPIEPDRLPDAPHEKTPIAAREQRETDAVSPTGKGRHDSSGMLSH